MSGINTPKNLKLYKQVKKDADAKFKNHGIYKSSWIVREYKKRGGEYKGSKPTKKQGLKRWFEEKWTRVGKDGKTTNKPCGRSSKEMKNNVKKGLCRPLKRVTKNTPKTIKELGTEVLIKRYIKKMKNPDKNIL
jgi:hypothetical protein